MKGKTPLELSRHLLASRRALIFAGAAAGVAGATAFLTRKPATSALLGRIDARNATALEEGFYLVDGWVLTADDLNDVVGPQPGAQ